MQSQNNFIHKKVKSYRQFDLIGKSNFEVYKVIDIDDNNIYKAIKIFPKLFLKNNPMWIPGIRGEVEVLKKCRHQNIIRFYEFLETDNNYYLVMEYCKDGDLSSYLKKFGTLEENEAIELFKQILNGYHELYTQKIMHRDLKLSNILLDDGVVKLADFGFAKEAKISDSNVGTNNYKAPEIVAKFEYDGKVDIWSLGVCLYELLFGKVPFQVNESGNVLMNSLIFPSDIKVSNECKKLLKDMLKSDPNERIDWVKLFSHGLFRNSLKEYPFRASDIYFLSLEVENVERLFEEIKFIEVKETILLNKKSIFCESEVEPMIIQDIQAKALAKEIENMEKRKKFQRLEKRYLHHSNVLRNMAYNLENGSILDPYVDYSIFVYVLLLKKLLVLTDKFLKKMKLRQMIFKDTDQKIFEEFQNSLFYEKLQKVIEDQYKNYETTFLYGIYQQFQKIEKSSDSSYFLIKLLCSKENPDEHLFNKTFLNALYSYFDMKNQQSENLDETMKKEIWIQLFFLYHCYEYWINEEGKGELKFNENVDEGFNFIHYRKDFHNMKLYTEEKDLRQLIEDLLTSEIAQVIE